MKNIFIEHQSKYDFDETMEKLEEEIKTAKWGLKHVHNLQEMLQEKGFEIASGNVLAICKPPFANEIMSDDELKVFSSMMPCRLSVYKKADGKTYISRMNIELFSEMIGGEVAKIMENAYTEVEGFVKNVVVE